jgi:hypothetical protein
VFDTSGILPQIIVDGTRDQTPIDVGSGATEQKILEESFCRGKPKKDAQNA